MRAGLLSTPCVLLALLLVQAGPAVAQARASEQEFAKQFDEEVLPLIRTHCGECHDRVSSEAGLDLTVFEDLSDVRKAHPVWKSLVDRVRAGEMPPPEADPPMSSHDRQIITQWIDSFRRFDARRNAGDPGNVLVRRLSNAEYDYSIRDLTGFDLRPTKSFPIDPANEAGFDNSGESLAMSPALMRKYLDAARWVSEHLLLTPSGLRFAPHPVVTDTDRDKYCVKRIIAFYERQPTDLADYLFAAYRYRFRNSLGNPSGTIELIAKEDHLSSSYLRAVWEALHDDSVELGPLASLRENWRRLPAPPQQDQARLACRQLRDSAKRARKWFEPRFENLSIDGVHKGTQAFVLWKNDQYAAHRMKPDFGFLDRGEGGFATESRSDSDFEVTFDRPHADDRERFEADCARFCELIPDAFVVSERGRDYLGKDRDDQEKGRLLSAGFHSMMGYYRDDGPLYQLILDDDGKSELDELWRELDFVTMAPMRQYQGFLWFDRTDSGYMRDPEFDFARPENRDSLNQSMIERLAEVYLAKATKSGGRAVPIAAIAEYFRTINQQIRSVERARLEAEPLHVSDCVRFAEKAFRRPLSLQEESEIRSFYDHLRKVDQLSHAEAIADTLVSVLVSPRFSYRTDLLRDSDRARPLGDFELASRLSYFLWSSLPDEELLRLAQKGRLRDREVLLEQVRRMLRDERVRALAVEFGGNWLDFRHFEQHNSVDRERFPVFDDALRSAMFEEPVRFFMDVVQGDRSVHDFLYADRTFVNDVLADHYGIERTSVKGSEATEGDRWRRVDGASRYQRGGLLPMSVFLTKNAPGLRTSPVKRGYWVVRRLLGERIPPPPPNVPELPEDESELGEQTLREALAVHRQHVSCAGCHDRFDSIGLTFEGFGPVGERRRLDLGGRPVDAHAVFPDESSGNGLAGLKAYLKSGRDADFLDNLCRKLLSYGLGRSLQLSDEPLVDEMKRSATDQGGRFGSLVEAIVSSPQFLRKRGINSPESSVSIEDRNEE